MSQRAELFVWLVLPYAAMVVFVAGHVWRYRRDQFGWTSRSSQMLESRLLAWGSVLFHYGAFAAIAGHVLGILVPESATSAIGISEDFYHDFSGIAGSIAGFVCLLGFGILTFRRTKVRRGDMTRIDPTTTVASLVAERPGRSREFERRSGPTGQPSRRRRAREHSAWQATAPVASSAPSTCQLYQPTASSVGIPVNSSAASFQARTRSSESQTTNASPERRSWADRACPARRSANVLDLHLSLLPWKTLLHVRPIGIGGRTERTAGSPQSGFGGSADAHWAASGSHVVVQARSANGGTMKILIVYGTTEGHTATLVERMRETIAGRGHDVQVERAGERPVGIPLDVDGVIVGASVHKAKYQQEVTDFVVKNRDQLSALPSAFFQVCLTAADPSPEAVQQTQALVDAFVESTGWHPGTVETFAGMLAWSQYDFFTRLLMKLVLRALHRPAEERDTSHDRDYTDYEAVSRFAETFAERVAAGAARSLA